MLSFVMFPLNRAVSSDRYLIKLERHLRGVIINGLILSIHYNKQIIPEFCVYYKVLVCVFFGGTQSLRLWP